MSLNTNTILLNQILDTVNNLSSGDSSTSSKIPILESSLPTDASFLAGDSITCNVLVIDNDEDITYQWYVDSVAVLGANESSYTITSLDPKSISVYCNVKNANGTTTSRIATITVLSAIPQMEYTGTYQINNESATDWNIEFKTSGILKFSKLGNAINGAQVFLVGGGNNGSAGGNGGGAGGAGGGTKTESLTLVQGTEYNITIGGSGGNTSGFGYTATAGSGASGGRGGWMDSSNTWGASGGNGAYAFGDTKYARYGAGGGGGSGHWGGNDGGGGNGGYDGGGDGGRSANAGGSAGKANSGGGGGGGGWGGSPGGAGGSGIVIIRNKR